jgi:hypothetical protein
MINYASLSAPYAAFSQFTAANADFLKIFFE